MAATVAALLVLGAFLLALAPLLRPPEAPDSREFRNGRRADLGDERERLVAAIRDADLDLAMGKVSSEDHAEVRRSLERQAVAVLDALEREDGAAHSGSERRGT